MKIHVIGGFLGSGKTTAITNACLRLNEQGHNTAIITNDQGKILIDSEFVKGNGIPYRQVSGGCFCCNYNTLEQEIDKFMAMPHHPTLFGESVGSCTDLVATVIKPLIEKKGIRAERISFSTFVDANLLYMHLKGEALPFSDDTAYIWKKQLEEARILIVNKMDLLADEQITFVKHQTPKAFPDKETLFQNSLDAHSIDAWCRFIHQWDKAKEAKSLCIDYDRYGAGEAQLTWLDALLEFTTPDMTAYEVAKHFSKLFEHKLSATSTPIGHLKFLLKFAGKSIKVSRTTVPVRTRSAWLANEPADRVELIVNARVQSSPVVLKQYLAEAIGETQLFKEVDIQQKEVACFEPGYPTPVYRLAN